MNPFIEDTIVAPITAQGLGAVALIRLSGKDAITLFQPLFDVKNLHEQPSHTLHVGTVRYCDTVLDEVVVSLFKEPRSFTMENVVEISCHGSPIIVQKIIQAICHQGARLAEPGEFTKRAFLNGRFDLTQAEAVADLISAETDAARQVAVNQMRGGFSRVIGDLRKELIHFASLVELELDFAEEDVEFAHREELRTLVDNIQSHLVTLIHSFDRGNVIKNGPPIVIAGKPNTGKSTLLNALLNEERAIVSDSPGTTRDTIEDEIELGGIRLRFIDTAGIRDTSEKIEATGVKRAKERMKKAALILYLFDLIQADPTAIHNEIKSLEDLGIPFIKVGNKLDSAKEGLLEKFKGDDFVFISAQHHTHIDLLKKRIVAHFKVESIQAGDPIVVNARHHQSLLHTHAALNRTLEGMENGTTGDLLAADIRQALHHLGEITGQITTEDLLDNIFSKFCIGK